MSILPRLDAPATLDAPDDDCWHLHPVISDDDIESERECWASERRRYFCDPSPADLEWWAEQTRGDEMPDALLDALADDALALDRLERGCLM